MELVGLEVFSFETMWCDKTLHFTPALSCLDLKHHRKSILILFLAVYNNGVILLSQLHCREHSPPSVTQAFCNTLIPSEKKGKVGAASVCDHPGADLKPALQFMAFPGSFLFSNLSVFRMEAAVCYFMCVHLCLDEIQALTSPLNKFARPQPRALALPLGLVCSQLPPALGGFGGDWGWALSLCQAFLWPQRQWQWSEGVVHAREVTIIFSHFLQE